MGKSGTRRYFKIIKGCEIKKVTKRGRDAHVTFKCTKKNLDRLLK